MSTMFFFFVIYRETTLLNSRGKPKCFSHGKREQCAACFLRYRRKYVGYNAGIQPSLNTAANVAKLIDWSRTVLCPSSTPFLCLHISVHLYQTFWSKSLPRRAMLKANDKFCYKLCENIGDFLLLTFTVARSLLKLGTKTHKCLCSITKILLPTTVTENNFICFLTKHFDFFKSENQRGKSCQNRHNILYCILYSW